ncbi:glycoside hydrolase family 18 [Colletotrichum sp. SAR11_239]|nr:glycoside hydrolase family 18 [Colletotrichum sp. SAR11_239]
MRCYISREHFLLINSILDNVTEYMPERRRSPQPVSEWQNHAAILKRQAQAAGEGALLCPTGECADGSIIRPKTCGEGSGTTGGRTIGYYQASNVRDRVCNRIAPSQIKTAGYSHLYFAFASIDPASFAVIPAQAADEPLMREFTALKKSSLQTWIAVGGYDFSDKGRSTHTTWHDLCASPAARAAFIASGKTFMDKYGFQGMDLDWEYPGDPKRGGSRADIANFVLLLKEMRASYGSQYGISLTLPPDIWYGQYFDAKGLEPYVDHFGFMSYDLHGSWDSDVKTLGAIIRGQADVREIYNNTIPLAYADLDFSKIVFGVAWYGRGYTVSDTTCNTLGCGFKGPSKPGKCTNQAGVMSLTEIQDLIKEKGLKPRLLEGAMMKELTWDDQWIGYDDEETVALKKKFANNYCFGGTMAWSVDFNSGTGDSNSAPVSTDGQCGPSNGGTTCTGSAFGKCCSSSGWCGTDDAHCGSGCQSGDCVKGAVTTDGSCGIGANDAICGSWPQGDCCSPQGWCGNTDAHCGTGCQSGSCKDKGTSTKPTTAAGGSGSTPTKSTIATPTATEEAWDMNYNWENHFSNAQKCVLYKPPKWEASQNDCNEVCKESNEANHELGLTTSATCIGFYPTQKTIPWESVGKGLSGYVAPGVCVCDNPTINWLGNTFVEMLPAMAQITCYVYIHSFKLVLEEGLEFIPEGKAMSAGMKALVNAAKLFKWTYSTVDAVNAFTHWLHPCDTDLVPKDFEDVFDKLTSISDQVVGWVKPSKVAKGSGKKGDKGYPN